MTSELRSARRASTLVLTISDAATRNVLTPQICAAGIEALAVAEADEAVSLVVVHGESIIEPVEKGTNIAALQCPYVDILAHPGLITLEEAKMAAARGC